MNYVLYGEEQCLLQEALKTIVHTHIPDGNDLNTASYDAAHVDFQTILEDATTIPFFSDYKIILVYHANFLSASNDTDIDTVALEKYLEKPMESTILVLIGEFEKMDARKKIVKVVKKCCKVLQFRKLDEQGKQKYIREQIKLLQLNIEPNAAKELEKRLPMDMLCIRNEMKKLSLYGECITSEVVFRLVTRPLEEDVFLLVNAVVDKNIKAAFHLWEDMSVLNKDAIYLIALLAGQFRFLYEVKALMMQGKRKDEIVTELGAHPYRVQVSMQSAERLQISYLLSMLERLATLDQNLKGGRLDKKLGFEMFLLGIQGA